VNFPNDVACGTLLVGYFFGPALIKHLIGFKRKKQFKTEKKIRIEEVSGLFYFQI
jgi:hypothetical protein